MGWDLQVQGHWLVGIIYSYLLGFRVEEDTLHSESEEYMWEEGDSTRIRHISVRRKSNEK